MNICGFILAAGAGTRMRPATLLRPKALLPFCGAPLLDITLSALEAALPPEAPVLVNACHLGEQVQAAVKRLAASRTRRLYCSMEERLLNHGGGLRKGIAESGVTCDTVLVHNADIVTDFDLRRLLEAHEATKADATVLLIDNKRPDGVALDAEGRVVRFHCGHEGHTYAGICVFHRRIFDYLTQGVEAPSIITAFERAAANGLRICGLVAPTACRWSDVGTYDEYIAAHRLFIEGDTYTLCPVLKEAVAVQRRRREAMEASGIPCTGAIGLGENCHVADGGALHDVVLWDNVRLEAPILYADGVVCRTPEAPPPESAAARAPAMELCRAFGLKWDDADRNLPRQGSGRKYCRLETEAGKSLVWSAYEPYARRENCAFAAVAGLLHAIGVRAPALLMHLPEKCELVCEDLGGEDLLNLKDESLRPAYMAQAMEQLARLHVLGAAAAKRRATPLQPAFDRDLYLWERDYFRRRFLGDVLNAPELWEHAAAEWEGLVESLMAQPQVTVHRDCQSANIKICRELTYFIDFQGMRLGAAAYDLGSILYDPYVVHTPEARLSYYREYKMQVERLGAPAPEEAMLHLGAVQRLLQALGAYGKLWKMDGLEWYQHHIPAALRNLQTAARAAALPGFQRLAEVALAKI